MRRVVEFFVRHGVFGDLLTVVVIGLGIAAAFQIRREVFPNVEFDIVTITTHFPGAAPEEVEKLITSPLEQDLKEVDGIKRLHSFSIEGMSEIVIFLDPDQTTGDEGKADVQDIADRFTELPEGAEEPLVKKIESKHNPIIEVGLAGAIPPIELRTIAKSLEEEIERLPGVAKVRSRGLRDVEIRVEADQSLLSRYRLSLDDLIAALRRQNLSVPGGTIEVSGTNPVERIIRTSGDFADLEAVRKTVIRANDLGQAVLVADVARVSYDLERPSILARVKGKAALTLTVLKKEKADAIDLVNALRKRMGELGPRLDSRLEVNFVNDFSQWVRRRLSILTSNLLIGLGMVLLMLPLMIPFRFSILIALGEPFAFLGTILILFEWGQSINMISMLGLIIVSGILIDDSIVVTENAVRLVEEGMDPKEAAIEGTMQIAAPVAASVASTAIAFLPMAFMSGIFGKFVMQIPIAVITALAVSLFETYFILPGHIAHWIRPRKPGQADSGARRSRLGRVVDRTRAIWDRRVVPVYLRWLAASLRNRYAVLGGLVVLLGASIGLATTVMRFVLFPPEGIEIFRVLVQAPIGTNVERMAELIRPIEERVAALSGNELDTYTATLGIQQQDMNDPLTRRGSNYAQVAVYLTPENRRARTAKEIIDALRAEVGTPPGLEKVVFVRARPGPPQGKPVSLGIRGKEYPKILEAAAEVERLLKEMPGVSDIANSYTLGKEELRIQVDSREAAAAGVSVASVGTTVRAAFEGVVATSIRTLNEEIDVRVSLNRSERSRPRTLEEILIPNAAGSLVPLSRVARWTKAQGLAVFEHEANQRQVQVSGEIDTKVSTANVVNGRLRRQLPALRDKFPEVDFAFGGEDEDTRESMRSLGRAFIFAVCGIFLTLVLTFRSLVQPLLILLTIPLGVIAVVWAFFLHGMPISFMGMLGIIALSGVIVNNAIVLVDFVNQRRAEGSEGHRSILEAAEQRIRPIFLTTVTTVIGILPTAYGIGGLDKFVVPIAMALGWGLMFGSILTAFVFPAALAVLDDLLALLRRPAR